MNIDYLIIGQGLAGSVLSFYLMEAGFKVQVLGKPGLSVSSEVAAGLYNPVTGRKMVKTWNADKLFFQLEPAYRQMEALSADHFLHPTPIYRPFMDTAEQNDWFAKQGDPAFSPYIEAVFDKPQYHPHVKNPYGGLLLKKSGWLDIPAMLKAWQAYLKEHNAYEETAFEEDALQIGADKVSYKGIEARKIIYCNGTNILQSKFWNWLPLRPVKGEVLQLKASVALDKIMNRGVFLLPLGGGNYKVGSTYDQRDLSLEPSQAARQEMLERLSSLASFPFEVQEQLAGIRPATKDRRPVLGIHPRFKTLGLFNGLGTKGVSLAPYCAGLLTDYLLQEKEISAEVNIDRFFSLYFN